MSTPTRRHLGLEPLCDEKHYCPPCVTFTGTCKDLFWVPDCKGGHQASCASDDPLVACATEET